MSVGSIINDVLNLYQKENDIDNNNIIQMVNPNNLSKFLFNPNNLSKFL